MLIFTILYILQNDPHGVALIQNGLGYAINNCDDNAVKAKLQSAADMALFKLVDLFGGKKVSIGIFESLILDINANPGYECQPGRTALSIEESRDDDACDVTIEFFKQIIAER